MFIDEWFDEPGYYKQLPLNYRSQFGVGQFFVTHAYYPHENLELWQPIPEEGEPTKTIATAFRLTSAAKDAFKRNQPLGAPKLASNEEFVVVRAKRRASSSLVAAGVADARRAEQGISFQSSAPSLPGRSGLQRRSSASNSKRGAVGA